MAIAQLEDELGVRLFEKTNRGTLITAEGIQLLSSVTAILKHRNTLISTASGLGNNGISVTFRLRYISTMFSSFIQPFLDQYQEKYVHLRFDISCSQIESIITDLNNHEIDIGFVAVNSTFDDTLTALEFTPVIKSKMVLACSKTNPLANVAQITPEMLREQRFCLYNETFQDRVFDRLQFCADLSTWSCERMIPGQFTKQSFVWMQSVLEGQRWAYYPEIRSWQTFATFQSVQ